MITTATIEEKSIVIADFMGFERLKPYNTWFDNNGKEVHQLEFHNSWEWLVPVIRKCKDISKRSEKGLFNDPTNNLRAQVMYERVEAFLLDLHVLATFNAVFEMIDWYNKTIRDEKTN